MTVAELLQLLTIRGITLRSTNGASSLTAGPAEKVDQRLRAELLHHRSALIPIVTAQELGWRLGPAPDHCAYPVARKVVRRLHGGSGLDRVRLPRAIPTPEPDSAREAPEISKRRRR